MLLVVDLVALLGVMNWCDAALPVWFRVPDDGNRFRSHDDCAVLPLVRDPSRLSRSPVLTVSPVRISAQHGFRVWSIC